MHQSFSKTPAPFGSPMPTRVWSNTGTKYKYGFNGKEKDDEITVNGGDYDFGARIYDSRLGRWLSLDPLEKKYPMHSPFSFCANDPILFVDIDGKDWFVNVNTGTVIYVKDASLLTKEVFDKLKIGDNPNNYERLGPNNMFGDKVPDAYGNDILKTKATIIDMDAESFMKDRGYRKAEKVKIKETEFKSGGRVGEENYESNVSSIDQVGNSRITYVKPEQLNTKKFLKRDEYKGDNSSSKNLLYDLTKPYGQKNEETAECVENKSPHTKDNINGIGAVILFIAELLMPIAK